MPSKYSYHYYYRFLKCLEKYLKRKVEDRKKNKYIDEPEVLCWNEGDEQKKLGVNDILAAIEHIFDELIKKAPSACMGADNWLDQFFHRSEKVICPGMWCGNEHCKNNNGSYPYNCRAGDIPFECKVWKAWRLQWRSYPEKEVCQKCRYFKPYERDCFSIKQGKSWEEANKYRCLCRAKELPENCPKKNKERTKSND
jgi:hypothetical protein